MDWVFFLKESNPMENKMSQAPSINLEALNPINDLLPTVLKSIDKWKEKNSEEALPNVYINY